MKISTCSTKSKLAMLFSLIAGVSMLPAIGEELVNFNGTYTEEPHPTLEGVNIVKITSDGTLTVDEDVKLHRILVVAGGGGGGMGGGAGGQVIDWIPTEPTILKHDDAYTAVVGYGGFRSNNGSQQARGHNGFPSSFTSSSINIYTYGGGGGKGYNNTDNRWCPEDPKVFGNGGGGAAKTASPYVVPGEGPGVDGAFGGGNATNYGSGGTGCGGGGGGAGAAGPGGDSQILNTQNNNDATQDEFGNYERAGDGGPGVISDITGVAISYGDGGGGGVRRSNFKHGGLGGLGNGGCGAGLYDGAFTHATEPTPNCGGGGGGAGWDAGGSSFLSTHGADGVVILLVSKLDAAEEVNDNRTSAHAFGGNVSSIEEKEANTTYFIHEFRGSGQLEINSPVKAELLLVGGGGAGGAPTGGGGGAGGLIHIDTILLPKGIYDVTVGAGGDTNGENGGDTILVNANESIKLVAFGGGGGGNYRNGNKTLQIGKAGGSGGGGSSNALGGEALLDPQGNPQGNNGGSGVLNGSSYTAGGGGGAGSAGTSATAGSDISCIGDGGEGLAFDITGELRYYAGGGGAGFSSNAGANGAKGLGGSGVGGDGECAFTSFRRLRGHNGLDGTGSGGGGGGRSASSTVTGGFGGTGVFILRYGVISGPTYIIIR